jgi:hypothetical protein
LIVRIAHSVTDRIPLEIVHGPRSPSKLKGSASNQISFQPLPRILGAQDHRAPVVYIDHAGVACIGDNHEPVAVMRF